ncbi:MAG: IPT/TIG domain-containing protein, partial [Verrucomicrobiota bacterium]
RSGRAEAPNQITVVDRPVITAITPARGPATGGTAVTISGSNFKPGATVYFDALGGLQVVVASEAQITCVTPQHFPATTDVRVTNTNGESSVLLKAFTFQSDAVRVSLPVLNGGRNSYIEAPLLVENANGIAAADAVVSFNPAVLRLSSVRKGSLISNWSLASNTNTAGTIRLSMASPGGTVSGAGALVLFEFAVIGNPGEQTPLTVESAVLNDGVLTAEKQSGSFAVDATYAITGRVGFWKNDEPVRNVRVTLEGVATLTQTNSTNGAFAIQGIDAGNYTLKASKSDEVSGITAYDASLILQHAVGLTSLTGAAATAADVNRSGFINSMDAYLVLQKAAGVTEVPFSGAGQIWGFVPEQRAYTALQANLSDQNFSAVLLGDVSGNWAATEMGTQGMEPSGATNLMHEVEAPGTNQRIARLLISNAAGVIQSLDLTLRYGTNVVLDKVVPGPMLNNYSYVFNSSTPGVIRAAVAGAEPLTGTGPLLTAWFRGSGASGLTLVNCQLNEGQYSMAAGVSIAPFDSDGDGLLDVDEV